MRTPQPRTSCATAAISAKAKYLLNRSSPPDFKDHTISFAEIFLYAFMNHEGQYGLCHSQGTCTSRSLIESITPFAKQAKQRSRTFFQRSPLIILYRDLASLKPYGLQIRMAAISREGLADRFRHAFSFSFWAWAGPRSFIDIAPNL